MPTKKVAKVKEVPVNEVVEVKISSLEDKLAVRDVQLQLISAKQHVGNVETDFITLLKEIAKKQGLNLDEYMFNLDNLTFQHK